MPSTAIRTTGKVALVRCGGQDRYDSLDRIDRPGTTVVENRGGTNEKFALSRIRHATPIIVPDNELPFAYLLDGEAEVMFTDAIEAVYQQTLASGLCALRPGDPHTHIEKVFLFRKDERALRDEFDAWWAEQPR